MTYQTRDAVTAMVAASGTPLTDLRVDGGASAMDATLQIQADQLGVPVRRPVDQETTALGAAFLAGLAEGVWPDLASIAARWQLDATFTPAADRTMADLAHGAMAPGGRAFTRLATGAQLTLECVGDPGEEGDVCAFTLTDGSIRPTGRH